MSGWPKDDRAAHVERMADRAEFMRRREEQAYKLRCAGLEYEQIAARFGIGPRGAKGLCRRGAARAKETT